MLRVKQQEMCLLVWLMKCQWFGLLRRRTGCAGAHCLSSTGDAVFKQLVDAVCHRTHLAGMIRLMGLHNKLPSHKLTRKAFV